MVAPGGCRGSAGRGRELGWLGARPVGPPGGPKPKGPGGFLPFFCFVLISVFVVSFSVLVNSSAFKDFIKLCFLYYNYPCNIQHLPDIFVTAFENFCCLPYSEFDFCTGF